MFVTVTSVAAMLVMVSASASNNVADNMESARKTFSNCVAENVISHLDKKSGGNAYEQSLPGICQAEKKQYADAIVKYERSEGSSASEAKEIAAEEVQMVLDDSVELYAEHSAEGTQPEIEV